MLCQHLRSAHIRTRSTPQESLAQPTMLLAFCAEGFALQCDIFLYGRCHIPCSTMRGRIKGTDSTINAILATAVLYESRWKIWNGAE